MKILNLTILGILMAVLLFGQQNTANIWYFAEYAGINFNTGIPVPLTNGQINTFEGCATLCDVNGDLIFYTDGTNVWNKNHQIMPNGSNLMGSPSASQSAIITPYPQNDSLYIVFTVDGVDNSLQNGLRYSIININLDGGLGDITAAKNILLHAPVCEKITAVIKSNQYDYWIIAHDWGSNDFLAYSVTSTGINSTPVTSSIGTVHGNGGVYPQQYAVGYMKASMNGQKIAVANYRDSGFFELFNFDAGTGVISNVQTSPSTYYRPYGVEFSPDGTILYGSIDGNEYTNGKIYQFNLSVPNPLSNGVLIGNSTYHTPALQLGPNSKIYVAIKNYGYLGVIDKPNILGTSCDFIHDAVYLNGRISWRGLPSLFYHKGFQFFTGSEVDTSICDGDSIYLENAYQTIANTYYDTLNSYLGWDSIVNTHLTILNILPTPTINENAGILSSSFAINYQWYFNGSLISGATSQNYQPFITGNYQVVVDNGNGCGSLSDNYYFVYTNIDEIETEIGIYPNPTIGKINIKVEGIEKIEVLDITGKTILKYFPKSGNLKGTVTYLHGYDIDLSLQQKGIYFIKVTTDKGVAVGKVVLE